MAPVKLLAVTAGTNPHVQDLIEKTEYVGVGANSVYHVQEGKEGLLADLTDRSW